MRAAAISRMATLGLLATLACGGGGAAPKVAEVAGGDADVAAGQDADALATDTTATGNDIAVCPLRHVTIPGVVVQSGAPPNCDAAECRLAFAGTSPDQGGGPYGSGLIVGRWNYVGDKLNLGALSLPAPWGKALLAPRFLTDVLPGFVTGTFECASGLCDFRCAIEPSMSGSCLAAPDQHSAKTVELDESTVVSVGLLADGATATAGSPSLSVVKLSASAGLPVATATGSTPWSLGAPNSAVACGADLLVSAPAPCTIVRMTTGAKVAWTTQLGPYLEQLSGGPMFCAVAAVDKACSRLVVFAWPEPTQSGLPPDMAQFDVGLDVSTGQVAWSAASTVSPSQWYYGGSVADASRYVQWRGSVSPAAPAFRLEWRELASGRLIGLRADLADPLDTGAWQVTAVAGKPWVAWFGSTAPSADGSQQPILGLADTWGNTTCETSGTCWQKAYADCTDSNPCTSDLCDAAHNGCYHVPLPDGITCSDAGGQCAAGVCK